MKNIKGNEGVRVYATTKTFYLKDGQEVLNSVSRGENYLQLSTNELVEGGIIERTGNMIVRIYNLSSISF